MIVPDLGRHVDTPTTENPSPTTPTAWLAVDPSSIPPDLTNDPSWYPAVIRPKVGKVGQWDKIPADPTTAQPAPWSDPATRCSFDVAFMAYQRDARFGGIGYLMHGNGIVGIDLDACVGTDGTIAPWALEIVEQFDGAYWERSISGTGLRGFCRGSLGEIGGCRSKIEGCSVELYADVRFLVVTGQALTTVAALPTLQDAVDTLHTRLTAGRVRATGTTLGSGLTGRIDNISPEALVVLGDVMGGRWGARLGEIWARDDLHVAGASEDDWALETEVAYQAMRRGHTGAALAQLVEVVMRAGPYRAKWDEPRGSVTWLAQDVANAIATVSERLKQHQTVADQERDEAESSPTDETWQATLARLEHELANARATIAVQMTTLRARTAERDELRARALETARVLRNPALKPPEKLIAIALAWRVESAASRGQEEVRAFYPEIAEAVGLSVDTVGRYVSTLSDRDDAPLMKRTVTEWREIPDPETGQTISPTDLSHVHPGPW